MDAKAVWEIAQANGLRVKATYTPREAARILGTGKGAVYEAIHSGKVRAVRVGRRLYVPASEIAKLLEPPPSFGRL